MTPTFTAAVRYFAEVTCLSPLRTGGSFRNTEQILRDGDRRPILQGTSLAGALRSWQDNDQLFGTTEYRSSLIVSDILFEDQQTATRPRLAIDGAKGVAKGRAKFDVAALPTGTRGAFQLTWQGNTDPEEAARQIEPYLAALHGGQIILGAMRANGFGRVALSVRRRIYRMENAADLEAWMQGDEVADAVPIELPAPQEHDTVFRVTARIEGVLIKAPTSKQHKGSGKRQATFSRIDSIRENGAALIPGSSLKGAVRGQVNRLCPLFRRAYWEHDNLFGRPSGKDRPGIAGVVRFSDGALKQVRTAEVPRIRINRLTGGIIGGNMFTDVPLDAELTFEIRLPADREAGAAILLYALRDLGLGLYSLGSGSAVGRGRIRKMEVDVQTPAGSAVLTCEDERVSLSDPDNVVSQWQTALMGGEAL